MRCECRILEVPGQGWGRAYMQGELGLIVKHTGSDRPGGYVKLIQPISQHVAFTAELGYNETYVAPKDSGQLTVGLAFGGFLNPHDFGKIKTPVPMQRADRGAV